jgi:cytochrome P450
MPASCPHLQPLGRQLCSIIQIGKRSIRNHLMLPLVRPPGPRNRGIIGNFPLGSRDPLGLYTQWARQYGDIFYYRAFNRYIYFLNRPDLIEQVLVNDYRSFIKGQALQFNRRIFGNGLLTNEGDSWLRQRHLIQPAFHRDRIASYGNTIVAYTERMMAAWQDGEVRDIHQDMMHLALEIVARVLFNVEVTAERDRIAEALNTLMELGSGGRLLLPPILRLVPTPDNIRYRRAARQLDDIVYGLIRLRRASDQIADNLLSELLQAQDEGGGMTDQQLRDEVMTLLLAGHETTAVSLSWIWYLLAQYPEVEKKLWSELHCVLDGKSPGIQDLSKLPYTERVVKEAMRLYPPAWAVVRNALKDCEIGGYRVPAGATVAMSQWVMHRDPRYYEQPERFNPDRWLDEQAKSAPKFAYFPFGGGPRTCIGASFAAMEAALVLAAIAQRFQIRVAQDHPVEPLPTITLRPRHGIQVVLTRRAVENSVA